MIQFEKFTLANGLTLIVHPDPNTQMVVVNTLYKVGARDEQENKTGFAHLFEHLMFAGSVNVPDFDTPLQMAGGENNAFTNNDLTNYYDVLPVANIDTALWLESDRMQALNINQHSLDVQKKVVIEEFKENYLNQPYGEVWHIIREMAYKRHPYKWPTIGRNTDHVACAEIGDVRDFFNTYYRPDNAIISIAGGITPDKALKKVRHRFESIPGNNRLPAEYPREKKQLKAQRKEVSANVPLTAIYKVWHMSGRLSEDYYAWDLLSDIMGNGKSCRLHRQLVLESQLFNSLDAYITGSNDPGLFVISGKVNPEKSYVEAEVALEKLLTEFSSKGPGEQELQKVKNKAESSISYQEVGLMNRAFSLAYFESLGHIHWINDEIASYQKITCSQIQKLAQQYLVPQNSSTLIYKAQSNK